MVELSEEFMIYKNLLLLGFVIATNCVPLEDIEQTDMKTKSDEFEELDDIFALVAEYLGTPLLFLISLLR